MTFVDAAFAFALTLLVISFDAVPQSYDELVTALQAVPAFAASFCLLGMFWVAHRDWSVRFGLDTKFGMLISLTLVFVLMVYVYPLRAMMSASISAITNGGLPSEFSIDKISQLRGLFVIFGVGFFTLNLCIALLNWHALRMANALALTPEETLLTRFEVAAWLIVGSMGILSITLALLLPGNLLGMAGWCYMLLAFVMPLFGRLSSKSFSERFP